jgi:hypothetical protein
LRLKTRQAAARAAAVIPNKASTASAGLVGYSLKRRKENLPAVGL